MTPSRDAPEVILASTSRYRRELVARLGLAVRCLAPDLDEEAEKKLVSHLSLDAQARHLAVAKARSLGRAHPDAVILGSDQIGDLDGVALGKPHTVERACAQLRAMAGRTHRLHTAVAVHHAATDRTEAVVDTHELTMRALSDAAIADYVARDAPLDCAGSYRVEALGIALFERVRGDDFTAVVGMPLTRVVELLARFGVGVLA